MQGGEGGQEPTCPVCGEPADPVLAGKPHPMCDPEGDM
jgi:hypothetical protein